MTRATDSNWLVVPQPRLGSAGLVALLAVGNTIVPLSLDMYTPAVPSMPAQFGTTASLVNLTILGFFLFYAIGLLVCGPLSDKCGRKPVLLGGFIAYTVGSVLCALSFDIWMLIGSRLVEALGAGAVTAVSTALIKDCFALGMRAKILSLQQIMAVIGPVAAPLLGGFIIRMLHWEATFWMLAAIGLVCTVAAALLAESLPAERRSHTGVLRSLTRLGVVARDKGFAAFLLSVAMINVPFMGYVAAASYIYVDRFGLDEQMYGVFFASAALVGVFGPIVYLRLSKRIPALRFTYLLMGLAALGGALMLAIGWSGPFAFCATAIIVGFVEASMRPYTTDILLRQHEREAGSASSLINFTHTALGCVGMWAVMLPWPGYVEGIGVLTIASMVVALAILIPLTRSRFAPEGLVPPAA